MITTTVTFDDLIAQYDDELDSLRDAYEDATDAADDADGDNADRLEATAQAYNEAAKSIQQRTNALEVIQGELDGDTFEIKMLSGTELMEIETELRMKAQRKDADVSTLQAERQGMVADCATVSAPDGVPTGDDGTPKPSDAPNPLTLSLYEQVERLNQGGATDFQAPGFDGERQSGPRATSVAPEHSEALSPQSDTTDASTPDSGNNS